MTNELDIFDLSVEDVKTEVKVAGDGQSLYKTDPKTGKDSVYRSVIRFIPNLGNPKQSIIKKFTYWLVDNEEKGFYADCPSSIGEKSIIGDTYWKLTKSNSAFDKKQAERLSRKEYYFSYIYVVKDAQNPELNNTVQIFRFPKAIKKIIDAQLSPDAAEIELGVEPTNVFDFFNGKDFALKVILKGGYWNYDECKFIDKVTPITVDGVKMENNPESRKILLGLYEGQKSLDDNAYKPWSDAQRDRVNAYLSELTGTVNPGNAISSVTTIEPTVEVSKSAPKKVEDSINYELPSKSDSSDSSDSSDESIEDWLKEFDNK